MKKIHILLLKAFIRPFIVTFFIVMFILLMLFLFKYVDDLIGKGFEWYTILELMFYASAANVSMALPLAILLSSIMTFGTLGENYELVAIKSAGVSLQKAMRPLLVLIMCIAFASFLFSEYMLPKANLKFGSLLWDVRNKKLSFMIKEGVFNNSIPQYSIRVDKKVGDGSSLEGVMIYDHTGNNGVAKIIMAKSGTMNTTSDQQFMILKLKDGIRYEEASGQGGNYNPRQQLTRMRFGETEQKFDLSSFKMNRTDENSFRSNNQMLNLKGLTHKQDSLTKELDSIDRFAKISMGTYLKQNGYTKGYTKINIKPITFSKGVLQAIPVDKRASAVQEALNQAASAKQSLEMKVQDHKDRRTALIRIKIEYQRKFTLAVSCILLFFIGAPLGAIIRKGGLGLPVVMAIVFFLAYHIISTVAEKSANQGNINPMLGIWMSIIVLSPLGVFLTYKATVDSALFDISAYKALITNLFGKKKKGKL